MNGTSLVTHQDQGKEFGLQVEIGERGAQLSFFNRSRLARTRLYSFS